MRASAPSTRSASRAFRGDNRPEYAIPVEHEHEEIEVEIVLQNGKPAAVILDIDKYQEMLERLEDIEDLKALKAMRKRPLKFRRLEDFLKEYTPGV